MTDETPDEPAKSGRPPGKPKPRQRNFAAELLVESEARARFALILLRRVAKQDADDDDRMDEAAKAMIEAAIEVLSGAE